MCTRYIPPDVAEVEAFWHIGARNQPRWARQLFPRSPGPFIRRARDATDYERELVVGQWALVPWFAKTAKLPYATVNARSEEMEVKASYRQPWARSQRCIVPAESFDEPNWESGKNVWWRFRRADGDPWGIAGLWNTWVDKASGEWVESYTMLTINADAHALMGRMHKPDPKLAADRQDKRSLVLLDAGDFDRWLTCTVDEAKAMLGLTPADIFHAGPEVAMALPLPAPSASDSGPIDQGVTMPPFTFKVSPET